jgi:hypothetical protein
MPPDARRTLVDLKDRLAKFGLLLHEDKTRLIEFGRLRACGLTTTRRASAGDLRRLASPTRDDRLTWMAESSRSILSMSEGRIAGAWVDPGVSHPPVFVVICHALIDQRLHRLQIATAFCRGHRLGTDILPAAGVVALV